MTKKIINKYLFMILALAALMCGFSASSFAEDLGQTTTEQTTVEQTVTAGESQEGNLTYNFDGKTLTIDGSGTIGAIDGEDTELVEELNIGAGITDINTIIFWSLPNLKTITVDINNNNYCSADGVLYNKSMSELVRYPYCKSGTAYSIPGTITEIDSDAFRNCTLLTTVIIPDNIRKIGSAAFSGCSGLESLTVNGNNIQICSSAFSQCGNLREIYWNADLDPYFPCSDLFNGSGRDGSGITLEFGDNVTNIHSCFFSNDDSSSNGANLTSVTFGKNIKEVGTSAFFGNIYLKNISLNDGLETIGNYAFKNCYALTILKIPDTVTTIGDEAFAYCSSMEYIIFGTESSLTSISRNAFNNNSAETVNFPESVEYYDSDESQNSETTTDKSTVFIWGTLIIIFAVAIAFIILLAKTGHAIAGIIAILVFGLGLVGITWLDAILSNCFNMFGIDGGTGWDSFFLPWTDWFFNIVK